MRRRVQGAAAQGSASPMPEGLDRASRARPMPDAGFVTVPNVITLARLCAVPLAVWLVVQRRLDLAFWLFVAAGLSDAVDGWLARRSGTRSAVGAILDPMADKLLLVSMYVTLAFMQVLPDWLAILVVFRDVLIVGGLLLLWVLGVPTRIKPLLISKANTAAQITLAALVLMLKGFDLSAPMLLEAMIWLVAFTTFASGVAYVLQAARLTGEGAS